MTNPYAPDETSAEIWFEQANNAAVYIGAIAYGVHIVIYFMCAYYLIKERKKNFWQWLIFVTILFAMATGNICVNIHFNEMAWIDDRNYPGGPLAFLLEEQSNAINTVGNSLSFVATFLADGLLLYRVYVVWQKWYIVVIPFLMWLAATVLSVFTTIQAVRPNSSLWANNTLNVSVPYWSIAIALNISLTLLLISRLLYMRHLIRKQLPGEGKLYAGVATMILESALPYSIVSVVFIILYGLQLTAEDLFIPLLLQVACIAPELIILRVTRGRALTSEAITNASSMRFHSSGPYASTGVTSSSAPTGQGAEELGMITFKTGSSPVLEDKDSPITLIRSEEV
ncbi:uncharacterized protein LAESUDRAFT_717278 [Laetiporus sulphureus 93-53]|uniref:Uncharacterized protein n=1 Tax=Laetiporus sulphureus 93-53 TaxID=1314785 RepID=A0A165BWW2_9APHY|nr:uncharacterized protein LAESUDRAFT_717278 [Laetiporus sulphureus 93-53]KZT01799.1 hypothetical protein LAESUDRAFT_717278 [Laetiporus sulphureus 93-53]